MGHVSSSALAQSVVAGDVIQDIRVEGTQRIEPATVRSYMTVRPGDSFSQAALDDSLTSLFATGLFADVVMRRDGSVLVVSVVENPIINRIAFEGNRRISDDVLEAEVQLRPRVVFTRTRVQNDVARILEVYRRSGRFAATVEPQIIQLDQNRVDLVFEIDEGPMTGVRRISFVGNRAFSDARLREQLQTQESRWWRFLTSDDTYDPDRLAYDRELLRRYYLKNGYADFRIVSAVAELTPDREAFYITFTVDEGERYRFGNIDLTSTLPSVDVESLRPLITTNEGDWYSSTEVETTIAKLTEALADQQFAFVDIRPLITRNREENLINITYEINEGPRVFVERINITGNVRTVDHVIRRQMQLVEGDPFNGSKLRRSETNIRNLGYFERVNVNTVPGSQPDQTIVNVDVAEQATGELSIGAGFSTEDGPLADFGIRERNLLGRGQELGLSFTISGEATEFDLSFTEPFFLDQDLAAGFDIFHVVRDNQDESSYDEQNTGIGLRLNYPLSENLRQRVTYRLARREIENVDEDESIYIRRQEGRTLTSSIGHEIIYDRLDSRFTPTDGYILRFGNELAGLGGDVRYLQTTVSANYYTPIFTDDLVLNIGGRAGYIVGLGEDVRINDRFFVGGNSLRGFESAGIGPRDSDGNALGGNQFVTGTVELSFPIGLPDEFGLRGRTFTDFGFLTDVEEDEVADNPIDDENSIRLSVGAGLSWTSPFGPIRIDFAVPVLKEDFDKEERFRFSFGTRF
jgi:outer membrane protein insertion porin family